MTFPKPKRVVQYRFCTPADYATRSKRQVAYSPRARSSSQFAFPLIDTAVRGLLKVSHVPSQHSHRKHTNISSGTTCVSAILLVSLLIRETNILTAPRIITKFLGMKPPETPYVHPVGTEMKHCGCFANFHVLNPVNLQSIFQRDWHRVSAETYETCVPYDVPLNAPTGLV